MQAQHLYQLLGNESALTDNVVIMDADTGETFQIASAQREEHKDADNSVTFWIKVTKD